ncbi:MAG: hypothetical protein IT561_04085 [Alphaproteobacteria bacterium]|nr:hypothetical protein [Alphaproteobacteria bacterium]
MVDHIRQLADVSIRRGCGFGMLAVSTAMVGVAHDVALACYGGAIMMALMATILFLKGLRAPRRRYRSTELWLLLDKRHGLPEERAQAIIGGILRERYFWHAQVATGVAVFLWAVSLVLRFLQ